MPFRIIGILHVPVARSGCYSRACFRFHSRGCSAFLAAVLGIELVDDVPERCEVVRGLVQTVYAVVYRYEANAVAREDKLGVLTDLQILPAEAGHILDYDRRYLVRFDQFHYLLPARTVEVRSGVAVVGYESCVAEAMVRGVLFKQQPLVLDAKLFPDPCFDVPVANQCTTFVSVADCFLSSCDTPFIVLSISQSSCFAFFALYPVFHTFFGFENRNSEVYFKHLSPRPTLRLHLVLAK